MKILDLFSGTKGWTQAFRRRGHSCLHIDKDSSHEPQIEADITDLTPERLPSSFRSPDVIVASPPCKAFSIAGSGSDPDTEGSGSQRWLYPDEDHPFYGPRIPNDDVAKQGCEMVVSALNLIERLDPSFWWLENPRGGLRTMGFMEDVPGPATITYCRYGEERMKPTDLWGEWPDAWEARPPCKNGGWGTVTVDGTEWRTDPDGWPCHHSAPRGAKTGTQGRTGAARYRIPWDLSWDVCRACEIALGEEPT